MEVQSKKQVAFCWAGRCDPTFVEILGETELTRSKVERSGSKGPSPHDTFELPDSTWLALPLNFLSVPIHPVPFIGCA